MASENPKKNQLTFFKEKSFILVAIKIFFSKQKCVCLQIGL